MSVSVAIVAPGAASASELIDRSATDVKLSVSRNGQAVVSYNARGKRWNVLVWSAINAIPADDRPPAGEVPRSTTRAAGARTTATSGRPSRTPARSTTARPEVVRHRMQGGRRLVLGRPVLAADAAQLRAHPSPAQAVEGAAALPLDRPAAGADRQPELGLPQVPPHLRLVHVPRAARLRLQVDSRWQPARHLRPQPLCRHARLRLRRGLEA